MASIAGAARVEDAMDRAKVEAWTRFHDQVIGRGSEWPRELWFAAVEDALAAALGPDAQGVEGYRRDVAELLRIEREASGFSRDEERIGQLTAQIRRTIGTVDEAMRARPAPAANQPENHAASRHGSSGASSFGASWWVATAGRLAFGLAMFGAGVLGTSYVFESRLAAQLDRQLATFEEDVGRRISDLETDLHDRISPADQLNDRLDALHDELTDDIRQFSAIMAGTIDAMAALRENALGELERRLDERGGDIARRLGDLHQQADLLGRGLDQVGKQLAAFERRLPELGDGLDRLAARLQPQQASLGQAALGSTMTDGILVRTIGKTDPIALRGADVIDRASAQAIDRLEAERDAAIGALAKARQEHLARLGEEIAATRAELDGTRARLTASWQSMDRTVSERQGQLLAGLEDYAARIASQVEGFVKALDGMIAQGRS